MTITVQQAKRTFTYNGVDLPDPGPDFTPEDIKDIFSNQYPELTTALLQGPELKDDGVSYTFVRNVGTKGSA